MPQSMMWLIFSIFLILSSCKKTDDEYMNYEYLLDYEQVSTLSQISIQILLTALSQQYPEASALVANTMYPVEVYRITYSTHYKDSLIEASGLVCVPVSEDEFPVISFQNATSTLHANAPSVNPYYTDYLLIQGMAGNGYVIFMPDYIGFGASEEILHPYYNRECTNAAVIDMIKAGNELLNTNAILAASSNNYYLMGYSQGGGATLSVLDEIENSPDPGFDVDGRSHQSEIGPPFKKRAYRPFGLFAVDIVFGHFRQGPVLQEVSADFRRVGDPAGGLSGFEVHEPVGHAGGGVEHREHPVGQVSGQVQEPLVPVQLIRGDQAPQDPYRDLEVLDLQLQILVARHRFQYGQHEQAAL